MASDSVYKTTRDLIAFLLRESDILRSPAVIFVVVASASRTAMIFLINETAERGGPTAWLLAGLVAAAVTMLATTHWARMSGVTLVQRLAKRMRRHITRRVLDADVSFFQRRTHGEVFHACVEHVNNVAGTTLRLVDVVQAGLLLVFCLIYMALQMPASVAATALAFLLGTVAFLLTEGPASRAVRASHDAHVEFNDSVDDLLYGYKELRLRRARRDDLAQKVDQQVSAAARLAVTAERYFSYGQIGATAALALLLVSIVTVLPAVAGADSVTMLQILTLVLFSFGPIEAMVGGLPAIARAAVSLRIYRSLDDDLGRNAEHAAVRQGDDNRPGFERVELRGAQVHLSREVGEGDTRARDTFTLGPVDLVLHPGQSVFITGGNGMGKSTLLQLLTGLRHPDAGEILLDGRPVTRESVGDYRGVFSAVFSEFYMFRHLYGLTAAERARLQQNIEELGIAEGVSIAGDRFANLALSTGQKRRLALSIALAEQRPIIVLDEFAADQDPARRAFFYDVLVPRLARAGHCVVAVTHDEHCFGKADRLIRMEDGKIVADIVQKPGAAAE